MNEQNNSNNSVAIVAIIVVGLLIAGAGFLYYKGNSDPKVVEKETVIEKVVPAPAEDKNAEAKEDEESGFSFEYEDEDGESAKIEAKGNDEGNE